MISKYIDWNELSSFLDTWNQLGGSHEIELSAQEPLLYRYDNYNIVDLVRLFNNKGFVVSITTNGQLLYKYYKKLRPAGLSLLRIS
ncbi:MAG: hypothetical protein LBD57_00390 [Endomicrobium sp.]|jgi:molybdenum cofactor biosynthesis enzyme MoaA|uniref:hypothetical protein n=1 Tax=Candidatus Endomicrobiellum cubanum TaxID=3242325 RepID=UPI002816D85C|nr:hypothetical protein [Endomicrobium sp.]